MKRNILIGAFWIITLLFAFYLKGHSQTQHYYSAVIAKDTSGILLADETTLNYTKTGAKITCENDSVFSILHKTHGTLFRKWEWKWDRDYPGRHKVYIIYLSEGNADIIKQWAKNNL
jgi:hypothetical protein